MSFLNPVNEPVLRFSSTDADAPQINYAARVAGDIKTVLKACLVVGYGAKASAGWSIANEVDHVAEFVSPSAAMSDYRLGIDDSGNVQWYYTYKNTKTAPSSALYSKGFSDNDVTSAKNGWQLIVTQRGLVFVELAQFNAVDGVLSRVTYIGANKQIDDTTGKNISCFTIGLNAPSGYPAAFFSSKPDHCFVTGLQPSLFFGSIYTHVASELIQTQTTIVIDSAIYIADSYMGVLGQLPSILTRCGQLPDYTVKDIVQTSLEQDCLQLTLGSYRGTNLNTQAKQSVCILIPLEFWGF